MAHPGGNPTFHACLQKSRVFDRLLTGKCDAKMAAVKTSGFRSARWAWLCLAAFALCLALTCCFV